MRIRINFTPNIIPVPKDCQNIINKYINDCLGPNNGYHDIHGTYNISGLQGGIFNKENESLMFPDGGFILAGSSGDSSYLNKLLEGVQENTDLGFGMKFEGFELVNYNLNDGWNIFFTLDGILLMLKDGNNKKRRHVTVEDDDFESVLKYKLMRSLKPFFPKYDFENNFEVSYNPNPNNKNRKKTVYVKNIPNFVSKCTFAVKCSAEIAQHIYYNGVGNSTNSGFGTICTRDEYNKYRRAIEKMMELQETNA